MKQKVAIIKKSLQIIRKNPVLVEIIEQGMIENIKLDMNLFVDQAWSKIDQVYSISRRYLINDSTWRHGPPCVLEVSKEAYTAFCEYIDLKDKVYCDLGCGIYHPYGISTVMFLNGASSCVALDIKPSDSMRASEAIYDLLIDCIVYPDKWHWNKGLSRKEFFNRIHCFDLDCLKHGDINGGLGDISLKHVVTDMSNPCLEAESVNVLSSRAVLEHFLDFEEAIHHLFDLMCSGGICVHHIDLVDHRAYDKPDSFHYWSFLAEDDDWNDGVVNRLRSCEMLEIFKSAGFEVLEFCNRLGVIPSGFAELVKGRFKNMSLNELSVTGLFCVLRKP